MQNGISTIVDGININASGNQQSHDLELVLDVYNGCVGV
jgi:hypothetical protein